jgi:hypothetical protein
MIERQETLRVFVGYDSAEDQAYQVCAQSILDHASVPVLIVPLDKRRLRHAGLYRREWYADGVQRIDASDGRPFSTEFAFTRFLVPALCQWFGAAIFCDCDFLWRADIAELARLYDPSHAVQVVKHDHRPTEAVKMHGISQHHYLRKNWSSLILWNCEHPSNLMITPDRVNQERGQWLHAFDWLRPDQIGSLPQVWNWLESESDSNIDPKAVHFTGGGPWHAGFEDVSYADEWRSVLLRLNGNQT